MWKNSETPCLSQSSDALADDNKRLQDMLHSALRREADALRRVKHLSDLLSECRVSTPSSGQDCKLHRDYIIEMIYEDYLIQ